MHDTVYDLYAKHDARSYQKPKPIYANTYEDKMNFIKICHWNANGISQHKLELKHFLNKNEVDVMLLSETHLTEKNNLFIEGFSFYKTNHPEGTAHGGSGILVRNRLKHYAFSNRAEVYIQSTYICLQCWDKPIT